MRKLLTLAIPMLLGVGLLTAAVHSDPDEQSKRSQGGVAAAPEQPAVIQEAAAPATTTTTAAPETTTTTAAPTTTTTLAPTTTTTARRVTPVTMRPRPRPTTTTTAPAPSQAAAQPAVIDCGTGSANARANLVTLGPGRYGLTVSVLNESTKAIELDELVVTADYGAAGKKQYSAPVAGKQVGTYPQNEVTISIPESEGPNAPSNFVISDFRFHTAGLPECASH